jgi:hypothetical protein
MFLTIPSATSFYQELPLRFQQNKLVAVGHPCQVLSRRLFDPESLNLFTFLTKFWSVYRCEDELLCRIGVAGRKSLPRRKYNYGDVFCLLLFRTSIGTLAEDKHGLLDFVSHKNDTWELLIWPFSAKMNALCSVSCPSTCLYRGRGLFILVLQTAAMVRCKPYTRNYAQSYLGCTYKYEPGNIGSTGK